MKLHEAPLDERIRLVEDIRDGIAQEQDLLEVSDEQRRELNKRLEAYRLSNDPGLPAAEVIERIRTELC